MNRPSRYLIRGTSVLDQALPWPDPVRQALFNLLDELSVGPYPDQHPDASPVRGSDLRHHYVAWKGAVNVVYRVMQDQPVIVLVGVHWRGPGRGPGGGEDGDGDGGSPDFEEPKFARAA